MYHSRRDFMKLTLAAILPRSPGAAGKSARNAGGASTHEVARCIAYVRTALTRI